MSEAGGWLRSRARWFFLRWCRSETSDYGRIEQQFAFFGTGQGLRAGVLQFQLEPPDVVFVHRIARGNNWWK